MTERDFLAKLADTLDIEMELTLDMSLKDIEEWDSLGLITFYSQLSAKRRQVVKLQEIRNAVVVGDLYRLETGDE